MSPPTTDSHALSESPVVHPRELMKSFTRWCQSFFATLDKDKAIQLLIERPGAKLMWALKLGRFPADVQKLQRDQNTVAGVVLWLYLLSFGLTLAAM